MLLCSPAYLSGIDYEQSRNREGSIMSSTASPTTSIPPSKLQDHVHTAYQHRAAYPNRYSYSLPTRQQLSPSSISSLSNNGLHHSNDLFSPHHEPWQSSISYTTTPEMQPQTPSDLAFTTRDTMATAVTAPWSPQDIFDTTTWNYTSGLASFASPTDVSAFNQWRTVDQSDNLWQPSLLPTQPLQTNTIPAQPSYRYEPFYSYKQPETTQPQAFTDVAMTTGISYPPFYTTAAQIMGTPIHPAFDPNFNNAQALRQSVASDSSDIIDPIMLNSAAAKQAISAVNSKAHLRSDSCSHASSHGAITKPKSAPKGGRVGPLTLSQREKVEDMRNYGACWRCRKYKKPCNGPGVCNTCVTSGFRVWPSALGCRRGDFDSFAFGMIPTHSEQVVGQMVACYPKPPSWRNISKVYASELILPPSAANGDRFEQLMLKVQTTQMTGPGVMELLQIACNLQRGLPKESRVLANTLKGLGHACEFYSCFVATAESSAVLRSKYDVVNIFTQNRKALLTTLSSFLNSCLTGKMRDWLPTFLSANFIVFTFVMLSDAAVMVPADYRDKLWSNIQAIIMDFRGILYPMAQDLLSALGKGSKLLHMQCWNMVPVSSEDSVEQQPVLERNREGMKILDGDTASFDGLRALQLWLERFGPLMRGDVWYSNAPHTVEVLPICSWERMFDFSPRG